MLIDLGIHIDPFDRFNRRQEPSLDFFNNLLMNYLVIKKIPLSLTEKLEGRSTQVRHRF